MNSLLFVQNGDFQEAYLRFANGGVETYRDQKRSVDYVTDLSRSAKVTTVAFGDQAHKQKLAENLWSIGMARDDFNAASIARVFDDARPTHVVMRTPHMGFLREARRRGVAVLPNFADIFMRGGPKTTLKNFLLRRVLLNCKVPFFSNHSLNASRSMVDAVGIPKEKIVPWDWSKVPIAAKPPKAPTDKTHASAFFAGVMSEPKGVGDCLDAVAALKARGITLTMSFAGPGDIEFWKKRAETLDIAGQVTFLGMVANTDVRKQMNSHNFVIVPSRHEYPEGLPNTIYEGLASQSVLILSDHPAFSGRLTVNEEVLVFKASDPHSLADCIVKALENPSLYQTISANAPKAHDRLYVGVEWTKMVDKFLSGDKDMSRWVDENSLPHWEKT